MAIPRSWLPGLTILACVLGTAAAGPPALDGTYVLVRDSDGSKPVAGATVTLRFKGGARGALSLVAARPGTTVTDAGSYVTRNGRITITFKEMVWEADRQPFAFDGCTLTLPFKALSGSPGPGNSVWQRTEARCGPSTATTGSFSAFSADETVTTGRVVTTARLFVADQAIRAEGEDAGKKYATIVRLDRDVLWSLQLADRTYGEMPLGYGRAGRLSRERDLPPGCRVLGQDNLGEYATRKEECTLAVGGKTHVETRWVAAALGGVVVKQLSGDQTLELSNIKRETLDPALFEIPRGFRKVEP